MNAKEFMGGIDKEWDRMGRNGSHFHWKKSCTSSGREKENRASWYSYPCVWTLTKICVSVLFKTARPGWLLETEKFYVITENIFIIKMYTINYRHKYIPGATFSQCLGSKNKLIKWKWSCTRVPLLHSFKPW